MLTKFPAPTLKYVMMSSLISGFYVGKAASHSAVILNSSFDTNRSFCRICIAVYKLSSCCEYRAVASLFGVSKTTVHRCVYKFIKALSPKKKQFIIWYDTEDAKNIATINEQKYKYPQAIGAIDGTHIPVNPPLDGKADYLCRKMYPSVVLQAVVDCHYKFRDIYANTPGSAHDATVFHRSPLSGLICTEMPHNNKEIEDRDIPLHILGDPAYPLSNKIMKGFVGNNLTETQDNFNVYLSSARMCVEIAFGKLKSRWRILRKRCDLDVVSAPRIITACCILHNMCEDLKLPTPPPNPQDEAHAAAFPQPRRMVNNRVENSEAVQDRDAIAKFLANTQPMRKSFHR